MPTTIVAVSYLQACLDDPNLVIVDCRHALADPGRGRRDYLQAHIPGAVFAHLDEDLSGDIVPGRASRHPLPPVDDCVRTISALGIDETVQVVAYDDFGGAIAARLWWMLRWLGHDKVAVLDGGIPAWLSAGGDLSEGAEHNKPRNFKPNLRPELLVDVQGVEQYRTDEAWKVVDSRAAVRYRGEEEPIDPVAGHIPGALSLPFAGNLTADKTFAPKAELKARLAAVLGDTPVEQTIFYCGSGVTAAHNLLAMVHAGMGDGKLYAGSWSEWITEPKRPVAIGDA